MGLVINAMQDAPKDGIILLKFKDDLSMAKMPPVWQGKLFVGKHYGDVMEWGFAAPVGCGGFPNECFEGWYSLEGL